MKHNHIIYGVFLFVLVLSFSSCSSTWISAPFTSPKEMVEVKKGMTIQSVNTKLGIPPYDVLHIKDNGGTLLSYKYRRQYRKKIVSTEAQMHNEESQTEGKVWYMDPASVYVYFVDNKVSSLVTEEGIRDSEALLLDDGIIQVLAKDEIDLYMLSKNDGIQDSTFQYDAVKIKQLGKVILYKVVINKKVVRTTEEVVTQKLPIATFKRTRSLPAYSKPTITKRYMNYIYAGAFNRYNSVICYERLFLRNSKFVFGAGIGLGLSNAQSDFKQQNNPPYDLEPTITAGQIIYGAFPMYLIGGVYLDKKSRSSIELNIGAVPTTSFDQQIVPFSIGYKFETKTIFLKSMLGVGVLGGVPHFSFSGGFGFRF